VLKIGIVGDCSQGDAGLFTKALDAAIAASDVVVVVGDINSSDHSSYDVLKARMGASPGKVFPIPGNHDIQGPGSWDTYLTGVPKTWRKDFPEAVLLGLDNSSDNPSVLTADSWALINAYAPDARFLFLFAHKALSALILLDGSESRHIMGEGSTDDDAQKLMTWMRAHEAVICCGHYHGASYMQTSYGQVILEGRGGSQGYQGSAVCGYTLVYVQPEGWTLHAIDLT
jgi:hypothetical protein